MLRREVRRAFAATVAFVLIPSVAVMLPAQSEDLPLRNTHRGEVTGPRAASWAEQKLGTQRTFASSPTCDKLLSWCQCKALKGLDPTNPLKPQAMHMQLIILGSGESAQ